MRRRLGADLGLALALGAFAQAEMWWYDGRPEGVLAVTTVAALVFAGLLVLRTTSTELMLAGASAVVLGQALLGGRLTSTLSIAFASMLMMLTAGLRLERSRGLWWAGLFLASTWVDLLVIEHDDAGVVSDLAFTTVVAVGVPFVAGSVIRDRRLRVEQLRLVNEELAQQRELAARLATLDERSRIAREMHDVVAHSVSLMVVQAGAARRMLDHDVAQSREALMAVEQVGREALHDLRRVLGLLRESDEDATLSPAPGLAQLDNLVERARTAGLDARLEVEGEPASLPHGAEVTAFRIVQEAVTNVVRHAGARSVVIRLRWLAASLRLEITDDGVASETEPSGGHGITGMRERAMLFGGGLAAGPAEGGGFEVVATLPYSEANRVEAAAK